MTMRQGLIGLMAVAVLWVQAGTVGAAPLTKAQACEVSKLMAAGKKEACLTTERANEVKGKIPNYAKCDAAFMSAFTKAESKAGAGVCPSEGDAVFVETLIDGCFNDIQAALAGLPNPPCVPGSFPATGQTTCWSTTGVIIACAGTGQDGDIQAGATLGYTDNGDGTITDINTALMWAKKSDDGTIHDKDTVYTWANAFAVHIAGLNAGGGFAGHTDWRLPNVKELQSIVNFENATSPSVSTAFDAGCVASCTVLTCSCTAGSNYWSSTTRAAGPTSAWSVFFTNGSVDFDGKTHTNVVRAVRGGS